MERTKETYQNLKAVFKRLEELGKIAGKKYCFLVGKILKSLKNFLLL